MGYMDKPKLVPRRNADDLTEERFTNLTNLTKKPSQTAETPPTSLRTNYPDPIVEAPVPQQGVTIPSTSRIIARLPHELERLIAAADHLPKGPVELPSGLVTDLRGYVTAWAMAYLTGDRTEALRRLWEAHSARHGELN